MSDLPGPIVFNTTVPSNLAVTDDLELLDVFGEQVVTVSTVIAELRQGVDDGRDYLTRAIDALTVIDDDADRAGIDGLDAGETHALAVARSLSGMIATDDGAARRRAASLDVSVTGSLRILALAVEQDRLTIEQADERLTQWIDAGYYSPIDSVVDVL